jgi:entericidin B
MQSDRIGWRDARSDDSKRVPAVGHVNRMLLQRGTLMTRLIALLLIAGTAALAGCNTMAGAGQDISNGGHDLTNSAEQAK